MSSEQSAFVSMVLDFYANVLVTALPITVFIATTNIGINMLLSAFMGKRLHLGGD